LPAAADTCISFHDEVAAGGVKGMALPGALHLAGNTYGVGGHVTTMQQCLYKDDDSTTFGWNWTRGQTNRSCSAHGHCKSPKCYADFSFAQVNYGVSPFGHEDTGASNMPVNLRNLKKFVVTHNVSWEWNDDAPGVDPVDTGKQDVRRTRFIYDFFLTTMRPNGTNLKDYITDEVTIALAANPHFPGSQPPGCLDKDSRFGNKTTGPIIRNAVWDGYNHYDYFYTDHHDAVPGTGTRFSNFRLVGADKPGTQPPLNVNLAPFFDAIRDMWKDDTVPVGPWLGHIELATELYDHCSGKVTFHSPPTFVPEYASEAVMV